jgi:predicted Zn-dependent protease
MIEQQIKTLLQELKNQGAQYADIRYHTLDLTESIHMQDGHLRDYQYQDKKGYGVRVLFNGAWGFYSS